MARKKTLEELANDIKKVWGDKYTIAPNSVYVDTNTPMEFICKEHGLFRQRPHSLLAGYGCQKCGKHGSGRNGRLTKEEFIERAKKIHGDKYDYSKVNYINASTKVCIICPEHGEFWQTAGEHFRGSGCPKCKSEHLSEVFKMSKEEFIERAKKIHNNKYDYSKVEYVNCDTPVNIICPNHGEFKATPYNHLRGQRCPVCTNEDKSVRMADTKEEFIEKAKKIHGDKYDYSNVEYKNNRTKVKIICPKHGEFMQKPTDHLRGHGCPTCGCNISKVENEIYEMVKSYCPDAVHNDKTVIEPLELDIYVPSLRIGIEYNGLRWHSEEFNKDRHYHVDKLEKCNENGIRLIQIFEDEWLENKELIKEKILYILGLERDKPKIFARKCKIKEVDKETAKIFLKKNHIQGFSPSTVYIGCFYNDELIGVMTFLREKEGYWNLSRFASSNDYICEGVGGKIFKYFVKTYDPVEIKSFADRRWTLDKDNNLYVKLGFTLVETLKPDYRYVYREVYGLKRVHKFNFRIHILNRKYGLPLTMTERQMTAALGAYRIWDCGLFKFVWNKNGKN